MARFILWFILIMLAVRAASKLVRGVLEGVGYRRVSGASEPRGVGLERDPVCGVYVVPGQALTSGTGTAMKYFCSEKCRREWGKR
jgi:YHS domain-containing protein